jgi:L-arabinokinase
MYASHQSYTHNALLGAEECDLLVELVRQHEPDGFYGAKITGGGSGGTVAIFAEHSPQVDAALTGIMAEYQQRTGQAPEAFTGSSPGAWAAGTTLLKLGQ